MNFLKKSKITLSSIIIFSSLFLVNIQNQANAMPEHLKVVLKDANEGERFSPQKWAIVKHLFEESLSNLPLSKETSHSPAFRLGTHIEMAEHRAIIAKANAIINGGDANWAECSLCYAALSELQKQSGFLRDSIRSFQEADEAVARTTSQIPGFLKERDKRLQWAQELFKKCHLQHEVSDFRRQPLTGRSTVLPSSTVLEIEHPQAALDKIKEAPPCYKNLVRMILCCAAEAGRILDTDDGHTDEIFDISIPTIFVLQEQAFDELMHLLSTDAPLHHAIEFCNLVSNFDTKITFTDEIYRRNLAEIRREAEAISDIFKAMLDWRNAERNPSRENWRRAAHSADQVETSVSGTLIHGGTCGEEYKLKIIKYFSDKKNTAEIYADHHRS